MNVSLVINEKRPLNVNESYREALPGHGCPGSIQIHDVVERTNADSIPKPCRVLFFDVFPVCLYEAIQNAITMS